MPHSNTWQDHGLIRSFTGTVDGEEILESNFELHTNPKFNNADYVINDFSLVTDISINETHARAFSSVDKNLSHRKPTLKIALVVIHQEQRVLAEHYRQLMMDSSFQCEIFDTLVEAQAWV